MTRGDRVGVLPRNPWPARWRLARWRMGAISVPLFKLFREDSAHHLDDSGARVVVTDDEGAEMLVSFDLDVVTDLPGCRPMPCATPVPTIRPSSSIPARPANRRARCTAPVLTGHLPGVEISHDLLGRRATCSDAGGLGLDRRAVRRAMPGLAIGAGGRRADAEIRSGNVSTSAATTACATSSSAHRPADAQGRGRGAAGAAPVARAESRWGRNAGLGARGVRLINEFHGQTECNMVASSCAAFTCRAPASSPVGAGARGRGDRRRGPQDRGRGRRGRKARFGFHDAGILNNLPRRRQFRGDWLVTGIAGLRGRRTALCRTRG